MTNVITTYIKSGIAYKTIQTITISPDPAGTISASQVMAGIGVTFMPNIQDPNAFTLFARCQIKCDVSNAFLLDGVIAQLRYGTGTVPVNGAAATGTAVGVPRTMTAPAALTKGQIILDWIIPIVTSNVTYWIDLGFSAVTGGVLHTATLSNIEVILEMI